MSDQTLPPGRRYQPLVSLGRERSIAEAPLHLDNSVCTLQQARELFQLAIIIYNCTRHGGLDGKQPALIRKEHNDRYRVTLIDNEPRLRRAMMRTEKNAEFGADGLRAFGRRYSATEVAMATRLKTDVSSTPRSSLRGSVSRTRPLP